MPLTRISLLKGKSAQHKQVILKNVYNAMLETFEVPEDDKFMMIHELEPDGFVYGKSYLGIERTDDLVIIQLQ